MKKIIAALLIWSLILTASCGTLQENETSGSLSTQALTVEEQPKFGGIYVHITIEDFRSLGFQLGDSVDIQFSNGRKAEDIPFYDGYYTKNAEQLLVAYPGYPYVTFTINNAGNAYEIFEMNESVTAVISLHEEGKYRATEEALSMVYENDYDAYNEDEIFANFRAMTGGNLKDNFLYRSASPCDNTYNRAPYVSALYEKAGVRYVLDLADAEDEFEGYINDHGDTITYWRGLLDNEKVLALDMGSNYLSEEYAKKIASAARAIISEEGPFAIHCTEGKDRTGFVCALLEAFAGANYREIEADYMKTYENYYRLTENNEVSYQAVLDIRFNPIVSAILDVNGEPFTSVEEMKNISQEALQSGAEDYLKFGGLTEKEIKALKTALTE